MNDVLFSGAIINASREDRVWLMTSDFLNTLEPAVADAAYRAVIVHFFDEEVLEALRTEPSGVLGGNARPGPSARDIYAELQSFPFVEKYDERRHNVHGLTRGIMLDRLWHKRAAFYQEVSARAAAYFGRGLEEEGIELGDLVEHVYHTLIADELAGVQLAHWLVAEFSESGSFAAVHALIEAVQEQCDAGRLSPDIGHLAQMWRAELAFDSGRHDDVVRAAKQAWADRPEAVPHWLQGLLAGLAGESLTVLGRFDDAGEWLARAQDLEEPGHARDRAVSLMRLGDLRAAMNRYREAEETLLDAVDTYVPTLLISLSPPEERESGRDTDEDADQVVWRVVEDGDPGALPVPPVLARHPGNWGKTGQDMYFVAVERPGGGPGSQSVPDVWPVEADVFLAQLWFRLGTVYEQLDDYPLAAACARLSMDIAVDAGDENLSGLAVELHYRIAGRTGNTELAAEMTKRYERILASARARGDQRGRIQADLGLGSAYTDAGDLAKARASLSEAVELARTIGRKSDEADALERLAEVDWSEGQYNAAGRAFAQALQLYGDAGYDFQQARLLVRIGAFELNRHRPDTAKARYTEALTLHRNSGLSIGEFEALRGLGSVAEDRLEYDKAEQFYRQAVTVAAGASRPLLEADALSLLANVQGLRGDHRSAEEMYARAISLTTAVGDRAQEAELLRGAGYASLQQQRIEDALDRFHRARRLSAELRRPQGEADALIGMMTAYARGQDMDKAMSCADELLALGSRLSNRQAEIATWCEAGLLFSDVQQHERAVAFLQRAVDADPEDPSLRGSLGWVLLRAGAYERSLTMSNEALAGDPKLTWVLSNRGLALIALGRTEEGLAAYTQAVESRPPGEDFVNDMSLLRQFVAERPNVPGAAEALGLLERDSAARSSRPGVSAG